MNHVNGRSAKLFSGVFTLLLITACADYGQIKNTEIPAAGVENAYSLHNWKQAENSNQVSILLTFSGGGTRAAALSYGVMQELRDTMVTLDGNNVRLLDQVNHISSVSGGSFTSAYYGLHGDGMFETYEDVFLRLDVQKVLMWKLANPVLWFSKTGRTDSAIKYYQKKIFHDATFADMNKPGRPMIVINASDLAHGMRFSFVQEYFDLLCSDLSSFPVARAVTASSAVPVLFEPVVLQNYPGCNNDTLWGVLRVNEAREDGSNEGVRRLAKRLATFEDKENRKFIHLVDGGITDNLGLRALSDTYAIAGGAGRYITHRQQKPPKRLVVIAVNASTRHHQTMEQSAREPRIISVIGAVTNLQLERMDWDTTAVIEDRMKLWAAEMSNEQTTVEPFFIQVDFTQLKEIDLPFFNAIPTSFTLSDEQVDKLIAAGRSLLRDNPDYQKLLADIADE